MNSPYLNQPISKWQEITNKLISAFPLSTDYLVHTVIRSWNDILETTIANTWSIANNARPKPQMMGFFLHEIVAHRIGEDSPSKWRKEKNADDKDVVCIFDSQYSFEIKTSSSKNRIFGNRSYAQETQSDKKSKSGYYLAINFEPFDKNNNIPKIRLIRFGWIDHNDWMGQTAASGQQARLSTDVETKKLLTIYNEQFLL
jgi:hypothetical protein